jgi:hypothetical protein
VVEEDVKQQASSNSTMPYSHHHQHAKKDSSAAAAACTNTINCPFFRSSGLSDGSLDKLIRRLPQQPQRNGTAGDVITSTFTDMRRSQIKKSKCTRDEQAAAKENAAEENNRLFNYDNFFGKQIEAKKRDGSYRYFKKVVRQAATFPEVHEHLEPNGQLRPVTIWCSNDYLVNTKFYLFLSHNT